MNHELAKELKDAGFPQGITNGSAYYDKFGQYTHCHWQDNLMPTEWFYAPTLSELIEACGYDLRSISFHTDGRVIAKTGVRAKCPKKLFTGTNPTHAVAKLWLALNRKV